MMIILIIIVLVTGIFYGADILVQGGCRLVHNDQPFIVSFLISNNVFTCSYSWFNICLLFYIDKIIGNDANSVIVGESNITAVFINVIDDCRNQIHFSRRFFQNQLNILDNNTQDAMNQLNQQINTKFMSAINSTNINSTLDHLKAFYNAAAVIGATNILTKLEQIQNDTQQVQAIFVNISATGPTLSADIVSETISNVSIDKEW